MQFWEASLNEVFGIRFAFPLGGRADRYPWDVMDENALEGTFSLDGNHALPSTLLVF